MLPVPFSFSGRIERLPFFKGSLALLAAGFIPAFLTVGAVSQIRAHNSVAIIGLIVMVALVAIVIAWISLALQVRRCRDIGWEPLYVIPAWIALQFADPFLAERFPAAVIGRLQSQTAIGIAVDLVMLGALFFWPSAGEEEPTVPMRGLRPRIVSSDLPVLSLPQTIASPVRASFGRRR